MSLYSRSLNRSFRGLSTALTLVLGLLTFGSADEVNAQIASKNGVAIPQVSLSQIKSGQDIVSALGTKAAAVAAWYGHTLEEFTELAAREKSMRVGKSGNLFYVCPAVPLQAAPAQAQAVSAAPPFPIPQTFTLHSRPGASKVIYLDFTGNTTSGTVWNQDYTNGANIVTPLYDIDGNPNTFTQDEFANMQLIWQQVAEDFAPFDVDVTTEDPGVDALQKTSPTDTAYGKRICIGGSSRDWFGTLAGGVAQIGSFDWSVDTPAFVFAKDLGNGDVRYVGEAVSHEAGHTLGLHHDGRSVPNQFYEEYYTGNADWAPIMGNSYYSSISQWSRGEYPDANNTEDDLAIIAGYVGFRSDDAGNTTNTASLLAGTAPVVSGIIGIRTDVDVFKVTTGPGNISFNLAAASPSPDLYAQLSLYNASGTAIATAIPVSITAGSVNLSANVPQGNYYVSIDGIGSGDPLNGGFSDYGSLGQYTLSASLQPKNATTPPVANARNSTPLRGAAPLTVNFSSTGSDDPDGYITAYNWNFGDGSPSSPDTNPVHIYSTVGQTYTASLTVTDDTGLTSTDSVTVYVSAPNAIGVAAITMKLFQKDAYYWATATVAVRDAYGNLKPQANVKGNWAGVVKSGTQSMKSNSLGTSTFTSPKTKTKGTFNFIVTDIDLKNTVYDPNLNSITVGSITPP